ncbi:MAG: RDD family protein, partial [Acidimicrobiales bacterium]
MALPQPAVDPTAVTVRRVIATLLDAALVVVPAIMLLTASFEYLETDSLGRDPQQFCDDYMDDVGDVCLDLDDVDGRVYFAEEIEPASSIVLWGGGFALLVVLQGLTGWTPGKLLTGIRTVREDGRRPGIVKAFLRWVMWVVDGFPYVIPLLGGILALTTLGHRRVGDMVAKTFVVRARAAGAPIVVPGMDVAPHGSMPPPTPSPAWTSQPAPTTPTDGGAEGWAAPGASAAPATTG